MMRTARWLFIVCFSAALSATTVAETGTETDKRAAIHHLLEITGAVRMGQQIIDQLLALQQQSRPAVPIEVWQEIRSELDFNGFKPAIVEIYDRHFSAAEINGLIAFYESDLGRQLMAKQPKILEDSMAAGQIWADDVQKKLLEKLRSKGYAERT